MEAGPPVFPDPGVFHVAAESDRHGLLPVADAEHRHAELEQPGVHRGRARLVDGGRPTGQDQPGRAAGLQLGQGRVEGDDLRVHVALADPPGDQLGVLCAEVHHQHGVEILSVHHVAFPGLAHPLSGRHDLQSRACGSR